MEEGTLMVPLKCVAKALGCRVSYRCRTQSYHLGNNINACDVAMNSSTYALAYHNTVLQNGLACGMPGRHAANVSGSVELP